MTERVGESERESDGERKKERESERERGRERERETEREREREEKEGEGGRGRERERERERAKERERERKREREREGEGERERERERERDRERKFSKTSTYLVRLQVPEGAQQPRLSTPNRVRPNTLHKLRRVSVGQRRAPDVYLGVDKAGQLSGRDVTEDYTTRPVACCDGLVEEVRSLDAISLNRFSCRKRCFCSFSLN